MRRAHDTITNIRRMPKTIPVSENRKNKKMHGSHPENRMHVALDFMSTLDVECSFEDSAPTGFDSPCCPAATRLKRSPWEPPQWFGHHTPPSVRHGHALGCEQFLFNEPLTLEWLLFRAPLLPPPLLSKGWRHERNHALPVWLVPSRRPPALFPRPRVQSFGSAPAAQRPECASRIFWTVRWTRPSAGKRWVQLVFSSRTNVMNRLRSQWWATPTYQTPAWTSGALQGRRLPIHKCIGFSGR